MKPTQKDHQGASLEILLSVFSHYPPKEKRVMETRITDMYRLMKKKGATHRRAVDECLVYAKSLAV